MSNFRALGISEQLCETLRCQGIVTPTDVQEKAIPAIRSGTDIMVQSPTGTGKTLAFLLPILTKVKAAADVTQALVITPTRELAMQTGRVLSDLAMVTGFRTLLICGGRDILAQKQKLAHRPQIVVGTPGRLLDHLRHGSLELGRVNRIVLDEADEMLKLGFIEDVEQLIRVTAPDRQILLFSATMPEDVRSLARHYMNKPRKIILCDELTSADTIEHFRIDTTEEQKCDKLCQLIAEQRPYLALVFCQTKQRVSALALALAKRGFAADELHGDLTQTQRNLVLKRFREAKLQILVATDLAARGLDIEGISHVYNYDLPSDASNYLHRVGRAGRGGRVGVSVTLVTSRQYTKLRRIEAAVRARLLRQAQSDNANQNKRNKKYFSSGEGFLQKDHTKNRSAYHANAGPNRVGNGKGQVSKRQRQKPKAGQHTGHGHKTRPKFGKTVRKF